MAVTFNELLEGTNLSEEARETIQEAWESRLAEAREEMTAELREEFAQRYEHDKGLIVEAVDNFISTRVEAEISELAEDKKALAEERVKYRKAVSEHAKLLDRFVTEMVAKEVKELHADRSRVSEHLSKLDGFVADQLAEELIEFHEDKKALVEQKVKISRSTFSRSIIVCSCCKGCRFFWDRYHSIRCSGKNFKNLWKKGVNFFSHY